MVSFLGRALGMVDVFEDFSLKTCADLGVLVGYGRRRGVGSDAFAGRKR